MSKKETYEDLAFLLLMIPFIGAAVYALVLWVQNGLSAFLPESVYLTVTKDPYLFLIAFVSVMIGAIIEVTNEQVEQRNAKLLSLSKRLQSLAVISLLLSLLAAWYANRFIDITDTVLDILDGRFTIIYPAFLMLVSFLILPSIRIQRNQLRSTLAVISFLAVPLVVYEVGKRNAPIALVLTLLLIALGVFLSIPHRGAEQVSSSATTNSPT